MSKNIWLKHWNPVTGELTFEWAGLVTKDERVDPVAEKAKRIRAVRSVAGIVSNQRRREREGKGIKV